MEILGLSVPLWLLLVLVLLLVIYKHGTATYDTFKKMGVPGPNPLPYLGNMMPIFKIGMNDDDMNQFRKHGKVVGTYFGRQPVLTFYDPELLKQVTVKEFSSFRNRNRMFTAKQYAVDKVLSLLEDDHWKHVRTHVSPTFSGSKMRKMMAQINRGGENLVKSLSVSAKSGDMIECSKYSGPFTMDVIARTAFSIEIDMENDKDNKFFEMGKKAATFNGFVITLAICFPALVPLITKLGYGFISNDVVNFFKEIVDQSIKHREANPDQAPKDFLQMMMSSKVEPDETNGDIREGEFGKWSTSGLTYEEILGQCLVFFIAGYSTAAVTLTNSLHLLAVYPEVQDKLYREIMDVVGDNDVTYEDLKKMPYLDMCLDETLRIYPTAAKTDRVASRDVQIGGVDIPKGMLVGVPIYVLHHDPDVWPEPDKFDPERFTPEQKAGRHEYQYMPFGMGPRNCVAMRLAKVEVKVALLYVVRAYKLLRCEKTQVPLKMKKMVMEAENGTWIKIEPRQQ